MNTPVYDFVQRYQHEGAVRLHMPGHKGRTFLGCEPWDITEIYGADALYEADGILAESEANAAALFGSGKTLYSTEGSSQCIRAMLYLALLHRKPHVPPVILAARNVHKAFLYGTALLDITPQWLWPEESDSLCSCRITPETLEHRLAESPVAAVYITSPDYLGNVADISALAEVCHRHDTWLLVDNAHGAYLHFLENPLHPLDLGADLCCDSAHKTLPVLTGGAYLHISHRVSPRVIEDAKAAMALFGSTSPSYLTLASLDKCNQYLADFYPDRLGEMVSKLQALRNQLRENGWDVPETDPLRITLRTSGDLTGIALSERLRQQAIQCEYADDSALVLMLTPENSAEDLRRFVAALGKRIGENIPCASVVFPRGEAVLTVRQAMFAQHQRVSVEESLGEICAAPTVSCPPAIPIVVSGERITSEAVALFRRYHVNQVDIVSPSILPFQS